MKKVPEILCFDFPQGVLAALREQAGDKMRLEALAGDPDLILCPDGKTGQIPAEVRHATPLLAFGKKPEKIGPLIRRIRQMLEEPSLFIADFEIGGYVFSAQEKTLSCDGREDIALTDREVDILFYLAQKKGRPVSRSDLLKNVWKYQDNIDTHTLETHIYRLRQKMEEDSENPVLLTTGEEGYCLALPSPP